MYDYLLSAISCLVTLSVALHAEECNKFVIATREIFYVPEGGSLSLSCVIQHCGENWTGNWMWRNSTDEKYISKNSDRHHVTNMILSANETRLDLNLLRIIQPDEGFYGCRVTWGNGDIAQGHLIYVNITAVVPSPRNFLHQILVCAVVFLCLPIILGIAYCLSPRVKPQSSPGTQPEHVVVYQDQPHLAPQPPPHRLVPKKRSASSHKALPTKSQQKTEVVYADISKDTLRQNGAPREPDQATLYSAVKFS